MKNRERLAMKARSLWNEASHAYTYEESRDILEIILSNASREAKYFSSNSPEKEELYRCLFGYCLMRKVYKDAIILLRSPHQRILREGKKKYFGGSFLPVQELSDEDIKKKLEETLMEVQGLLFENE